MLLEVAIEPKRPQDTKVLLETLAEVAPQGARFGVKTDQGSGQTILLGDSEEDLAALIDRAKENGTVEFNVGALQVAYRETLARSATVKHTHKRFVGPAGQFAQVTIKFEPLPRGSGFEFDSAAAQEALPSEYISPIERGLRFQKESGLIAGFPVIDFKASLIDGAYHEVDSNALSFDTAARAAFRELKDVAVLLEPVMYIEVVTPDDFLGGVIGDINSRRGMVLGSETVGHMQVIAAEVPLANMFGYRNVLNAMSRGRVSYLMRFDRYDRASPGNPDPPFPQAMAMRA